jgi:hypothetical protein
MRLVDIEVNKYMNDLFLTIKSLKNQWYKKTCNSYEVTPNVT